MYNFGRKQAPREEGAARPPSRTPQESRGPMKLKVQKRNGQLCTKFCCYGFIYTVLCKLIDQSCFFRRYTQRRC